MSERQLICSWYSKRSEESLGKESVFSFVPIMTGLNFLVISTLGEISSIKQISPSRLAGQALCGRNDRRTRDKEFRMMIDE